jgi:hypothetical protein
MLADEQNSSDSTGGFANLRGTQVYDNIIAGCRIGIRDYSEGAQSIPNHGLKDTLIANNTIIMPAWTFQNSNTYGIYLQDNGSQNTNSFIQNNIVYGFQSDPLFHSEKNGTLLPGINIDYNLYFSATAKPFSAGYNNVVTLNFTQWKAAIVGADTHSIFADPLLLDVTAFRGGTTNVYDHNKARLQPGSPALGTGTPQPYTPAVNFANQPRSTWNIGAY